MEGMTQHQKGVATEKAIGDVLTLLRDEDMIRGFRKTRRYSMDDKRGIDYWIFTETLRVPLQVKSSHKARFMHEYNCNKKWIPCVVWCEDVNKLKRIIMHLIQGYIRHYGNATG